MQPNRLSSEQSPYLLQHAHNPVDWHPWSEEAFEKARAEDKPVFLSIGYATCHWCHVMERESFEDREAARHLNETFVSIKVDREERPDIDAVYMAACQMLTGSGGWPLTLFMTPDRIPFFAATYIPKRSQFGRPGLIDLCVQIGRLWSEDRKKIIDSATAVSGRLGEAFSFAAGEEATPAVLDAAYAEIERSYDARLGGFGQAPKFPTPHRLLYLLRYHRSTGKGQALEMVKKTLVAMRLGGIWDHVGFGFHRYATDREWLLPHFEKMLYDQALLAMAYLETYAITGDSFFADTAGDIFTYVLRDMKSPEGPFFAAEDADSEGVEGKFYVWTLPEFRSVTGPEAGDRWASILNLSPEGNFTEEGTGHRTGANILHLKAVMEETARGLGLSEAELLREWASVRTTLFEARNRRVRPLRDDKILTDWNGLMIAALSRGARVLDNPEYARAAEGAARFILSRLRDGDGNLLHRFRNGHAGIRAHADDYAFIILGLLELYRAESDRAFLEEAAALQARMIADYWDTGAGGFFLTPEESRDLPVRPKELYDGALPSANSVSLVNLDRLDRFTGTPEWKERSQALIRAFLGTVRSQPSAFTHFLIGLDRAIRPGGKGAVLEGTDSAGPGGS